MKVEELINQTKAYYCLDCGVCTGSCPVGRVLSDFSPRLIVEKSLLGMGDDILRDRNLWSCLTCGRCSHRCPSNIDYPEFVRATRMEALKMGNQGVYAHNGIIQTIMEIQTLAIHQNKTAWAKEAGRIAPEGEYYLFVGCLPYFDVIFRDINVLPLNTAKNILKILNKIGIDPVIDDNERCCGHDMLWNGEIDKFRKLAALNVDLIKQKGSKKVIFGCPEGYFTFKKYYPMYLGKLGFEVIHFYEFISDRLKTGGFKLSEIKTTVTYQDPCRLGRFSGVYQAPRDIICGIPGVRLVEMGRNKDNSVCCGTSGWVNCSSFSKQIQMERLKEAKTTGAKTLITACPKCQIHFTCALSESNLGIKVKDLSDFLAAAIGA